MARRTRSLEDVVSQLWTGGTGADIFVTPLHVVGGANTPGLPILNRMQSILPLVAARDELADDLSPRGIAQTGWRRFASLEGGYADALPDAVESFLRGFGGGQID